MRFFLEELEVLFPYEYIYPEQFKYMFELKRGLDRKGHLLLEMPCGTGKTIALLAILLAYWNTYRSDIGKVIYCTRTVAEIMKVMEELRRLIAYTEKEGKHLHPLLAIGVSARKNMCIHPSVSRMNFGPEVDAACRKLTARWIDTDEHTDTCSFFKETESVAASPQRILPPGVYGLEDLRRVGEERGLCPYWLSRVSVEQADFLFHSYTYLVDPQLSAVIKSRLPENSVVVLDEGHNVDDVCIEAFSRKIERRDIEEARNHNIPSLEEQHSRKIGHNLSKIQNEFVKLVDDMQKRRINIEDQVIDPKQLSEDMHQAAVTDKLKDAKQFLVLLRKIVDLIQRTFFRMSSVHVCKPETFIRRLKRETRLDARELRYCGARLRLLLNTLEIADTFQYRHISVVCTFLTYLSSYDRDAFTIIFEPFDPTNILHTPDPVLQLACLDASLGMKSVFKSYHNVILTSGTLSPLHIFPKILGFSPIISKAFEMTINRKCIAPIIVSRGFGTKSLSSELVDLNTSYKTRQDDELHSLVEESYANLLLALVGVVPDGMVCFFTGYTYMGKMLHSWKQSGILDKLAVHKLLFVETKDVEETNVALQSYRHACDVGRGAIFFSIARGKISEGIDFDSQYGRCVVMIGVPFLPPEIRALNERKRWIEEHLKISESEYVTFDAMRQSAQCIGRVLRNKADYGVMVLADCRFSTADKISKLPQWILQNLGAHMSITANACIEITKKFFRNISQYDSTYEDKDLLGTAELEKLGALHPTPPIIGRQEQIGYIPISAVNPK
ncbi:TFIIH basal transcription factor complex helicase subunit [Perkinsela sp. CCAP 1560/4]|nr:TFIIH basal transcription factor complex helicase subunit [Perkinsela sp. CCAP 1560/4]|eukprot:KNH01734.1 TFIIH basal transcription factor complex helicase subunit [Perkinsela sp. CCAP 1560/4]